MSRKNAVKNTPKTVPSARKKTTSPRRTTGAQDLAPTLAETLPTTPAETVVENVVETVVENVVETTFEAVSEVAPDFAPLATPSVMPAVTPYTISRSEFDMAVRREAWLLAEHRGFRNGSAFEDWIRAEAGVRARLDAEGVAVR
jgi:hypothetical protein